MRAPLLLAAALLAAPLMASAALVVLAPSDDVSVFQDAPDNASGVDPVLYVGTTRFGSPRRCLLKFDLSALPAGADVHSAVLMVHVERAQGDPGPETHTLHRITTAWSEGPAAPDDPGAGGLGLPAVAGDVTWNDAVFPGGDWAVAGGDFVAAPSATQSLGIAGTYAHFTDPAMASDIEAWLAAPATNHGWILVGDEATAFNARRLHSAEAATMHPKLAIDYSPPASTNESWFVY